MAGAFPYRPKFVDIRVRPPKAGEDDAPAPGLKAGERRCDHEGCLQPATARAPKGRDLMDQHYWFCAPHAAEYNKGWNYFAGMDDDAVQAFREDEAKTGGRPTWQFKAGRFSREAAAFAAKFGSGAAGKGAGAYADAFDVFGRGGAAPGRKAEAAGRKLGVLERKAFGELDLAPEADGPAIRARYLDLVKRFHPDTNGGDRTAEEKLGRVIKAFKTLQRAKLTA